MVRKSVRCGVCGEGTEYIVRANFTVYCPKCKHMVHNECERGFGPVTPYYFCIGDDILARVDVGKDNRYILYLPNETIPLENTYYNAVEEADGILSERFGFKSRWRKNGE